MAANHGYGTVTDRAFIGFGNALDEGGWKHVDAASHEQAGQKSAAALMGAPHDVVWKLMLRWAVRGVSDAFGAVPLSTLDAAWDASQRRLSNLIAAAEDDPAAEVRAAAGRLRAALLAGSGTAQTQYEYGDEVDFGRTQGSLTAPGTALAADVAKVEVAAVLADVAQATEALAQGIGRAKGQKAAAPSKVIRDAVTQCATVFNGVHDQLSWFLARTPPSAEHDQLAALLAPLEALLARRAPAPAPAAPAAGGTTGTPPAQP